MIALLIYSVERLTGADGLFGMHKLVTTGKGGKLVSERTGLLIGRGAADPLADTVYLTNNPSQRPYYETQYQFTRCRMYAMG
ncbi:hypothetical protein [Sediminibacterium soli]|uniref:hypothetical protein n=1 Tax=Sediminibacterium soli TaxID=2698829 RepID=UPI0013797116|nr:hypothetical protein [Sediminibacterium soli]NCI47172.1 hypothetical protein [Sediminibacterium soli]